VTGGEEGAWRRRAGPDVEGYHNGPAKKKSGEKREKGKETPGGY